MSGGNICACSVSQLKSLLPGRSGLHWEESIIHVLLTGRVVKLSSKYSEP